MLGELAITNNTTKIIMSLFYEDNIFSTTTNLTYGPRLKNKHEIITQYLQYIHKYRKIRTSSDHLDLPFNSKGLHFCNINIRHILPNKDELRIVHRQMY